MNHEAHQHDHHPPPPDSPPEPTHLPDAPPDAPPPPLAKSLIKLARPKQWSKSAFVLIGPLYGMPDMLEQGRAAIDILIPAFVAAFAFALASSACYVFNDISDREADRLHPRKRLRPLAAGHISPNAARIYAGALAIGAGLCVLALPSSVQLWTLLTIGLYIINVMAYSWYFKRKVIGDVVSLSIGFVLRVMGGCAAVGIEPTTWLLNVTFFLSMFLAFGKRLGERRTLNTLAGSDGNRAVAHRAVQERYSDVVLQMAVVVTAVATLLTYSMYVQAVGDDTPTNYGFNLLWLTLLPATYGLLRCIVMLESGRYDDPTELAFRDRGFLAASLAFGAVTALVLWMRLTQNGG